MPHSRSSMRKHRNVPTACGLFHHHKSKAEAQRCEQLWALLRQKHIAWFAYEPHIDLAGVPYRPDFIVVSGDYKTRWFEEIKSPHTDKTGGRWAVIQTLWRRHARWPLRVIHCKRGVLRENRTIYPDPK